MPSITFPSRNRKWINSITTCDQFDRCISIAVDLEGANFPLDANASNQKMACIIGESENLSAAIERSG